MNIIDPKRYQLLDEAYQCWFEDQTLSEGLLTGDRILNGELIDEFHKRIQRKENFKACMERVRKHDQRKTPDGKPCRG